MSFAIVAGAGIAAAGAIGGAVVSSDASESAANTQAQSASTASQEELDASNNSIAAQQQAGEAAQANQQPWINAGSAALSQLGGLLGIQIAPSGQYAAPSTMGASGSGGGSAGGSNLFTVQNGQFVPNPQLMQSNPQFAQAWQKVIAANQANGGTAYVDASAPNANGMLSSLTSEMNDALTSLGVNPQSLAASQAGSFQPGMTYGGPTGGSPGSAPMGGVPGSAGQQALSSLSNLAGWNGADPSAALAQTPGYQFSLSQGLNAVENSSAANGLQLSGGNLKDLNNYAQGQASTLYQTELGDAQSLYGQQLGALENVAGLGGSAASSASGNTVATGQGIGNTASSTGAQIGANTIGAGNAQAAGTVGSANALSSGLNSAGNSASQIYTLNSLFGNGNGNSAAAASTYGPYTAAYSGF